MSRLAAVIFRALLLLAVVTVAVPPDISAQATASMSPAEERLRELFADLSPRDDLQLTTPVLFIERANVESLNPRSVLVRTDGEPQTVNLEEIRAVSVRRAHSLQGSLWGLGSGLLVGSVGGLLVGSFGCTTPDECTSSERDGAILGAIIVGGVSTVTGFLLGRRDVYWKPVFP